MNTMRANINCSANFIVIALLPTLFFITLLAGYLELIPLNIPIYTLVYIGFILLVFLLFIQHNANFAACKMRGGQLSMEIALKTELLATALVFNSKSKSILNIDDFLNRYYINVRNDNFVSVASSIFPMLGILGTFVAMAISMPNFTASDTNALDSEISLLLSGVGSAFFASIYGIFLSLLWTYFEKRGLSKIDEHFKQINALFASQVWTKEELTIEKYRQKVPQEEQFVKALKEAFNLEILKEINQEQLKTFEQIMQTNNQTFKDLAHTLERISSEIRESLSVIDSSRSSIEARAQIERNINEFTKAIKTLDANVKNITTTFDNSLSNTFEQIDKEIGTIVIKLADFATHVSLESSEVQKSISAYHKSLASKSQGS